MGSRVGNGLTLRIISAAKQNTTTVSLTPEFVAGTRVGRRKAGGLYTQSYEFGQYMDAEGKYVTLIFDYSPPNLLDSELAVVQLSEHDSRTVNGRGACLSAEDLQWGGV